MRVCPAERVRQGQHDFLPANPARAPTAQAGAARSSYVTQPRRRRRAADDVLEREHVGWARRDRAGGCRSAAWGRRAAPRRRNSVGEIIRRSGPAAASASGGPQKQRRRTAAGRVQRPGARPPGEPVSAATREAAACRRMPARRSRVARGPASFSTRRPGVERTLGRGGVETKELRRLVADPRERMAAEAHGARLHVAEAVLGDRVARRGALDQPSRNLRSTVRQAGGGPAAGITSSVTRSTPRSLSQSRISAARSNVAGSMSWTATASRPSGRIAGLARADPARASR